MGVDVIGRRTGYATIAAQMVVLGTGMGLTSAPATEAIIGVVPKAKAGIGSAVNDATRLLGGTLGVAVIGSVYASLYASRLTAALPARRCRPGPRAPLMPRWAPRSRPPTRLSQGGHPALAAAVHDAANAAFFHGFTTADYLAAGVAAAGGVMALALLPAQPAAIGDDAADLQALAISRGGIGTRLTHPVDQEETKHDEHRSVTPRETDPRDTANVEPALERNRAFAAAGGHEGAVVLPHLRLFVITCLDPRVDPAHFLGLELSDAIVVRNVGGRVTPEVINDVAFIAKIAESVLPDGPLFEVAVIHHTQCGAGAFADDTFRRDYAQRIGVEEATLREHAVLDPVATVTARRRAPPVRARDLAARHRLRARL